MMKENKVSLESLCGELLNELQQHHYSKGTIQLYKERIQQLQRYMSTRHISYYSPKTAVSFYRELIEPQNYVVSTKRFYKTVIRRLNDCYNDNGYVLSVPRKDLTLTNQFQPVASEYLSYCIKIGNSDFTLKAKERAMHFFCTNLESLDCHCFEEMTVSQVSKAALMVKNHEFYTEIRDLMRYLNASNHVCADFSTLIPKNTRGFRVPTTYSPQEISKIEESVNKKTSPGKRDYAIILLASRLGIRAGDIAALKLSNLNFEEDRIHFIQRKTGNNTDLIMLPEIKIALQDYILNERPDSTLGSVFLSSCAPYEEISYSVVSFAVKKHMKRACIDTLGKKHGPHSLRSSLATSMVNDGVDYNSVRKILGHEGPNAIKYYAKINIEMLRLCALEAMDPSGFFKHFLEGGDN
ncbi:MAG: tyrosine-type recombinase/integrase [Cellulosilyticaceae bacterium]